MHAGRSLIAGFEVKIMRLPVEVIAKIPVTERGVPQWVPINMGINSAIS